MEIDLARDYKKQLPPPLSEINPFLAQRGGYNNRRGESPSGPQTIWTGVSRMTDDAIDWLNFGQEKHASCESMTAQCQTLRIPRFGTT